MNKIIQTIFFVITLLGGLFLIIFFTSPKNSTNAEDVRVIGKKNKDSFDNPMGCGLSLESVARKYNLLKFSGAETEHSDELILNAKREEAIEYSRAGNFANTRTLLKSSP